MVVISLSAIAVIRWTAAFKDFIDSRKTADTRRVYGSPIRKMLVDPGAFTFRG